MFLSVSLTVIPRRREPFFPFSTSSVKSTTLIDHSIGLFCQGNFAHHRETMVFFRSNQPFLSSSSRGKKFVRAKVTI